MKRHALSTFVLLLAAALAVPFAASALTAGEKTAALPKDFRAWTHTKSMVIPDKSHGLYGFHNIYANKAALPDPGNPDLILPGTKLTIPSIQGELREGLWKAGLKYPTFTATKCLLRMAAMDWFSNDSCAMT